MSIDETPIDYNVPSIGWKVKLDHVFEEKRNQNVKPRWHQVRQLFPLAIRYIFYHVSVAIQSRQPLMNYLKQETGKQIYGVPIGGIGSGTIGRGFKGEFCRFQLRPGRYEYNTVPADNFIVTIQNSQGRTLYQKVLSTYGKPKKILSSWDWDFDGSQAEYTALYPRSWTVFRIPDHAVTLICRQISPVTPHNYKVGSTVYVIKNLKWETMEITVLPNYQP